MQQQGRMPAAHTGIAPKPALAAAAQKPSPASELMTASAPQTGTAVGKKVMQIRGELAELQGRVQQNSSRLTSLRTGTMQNAQTYHSTKADIEARLQVGTTPGNPELVQKWNAAQAGLDRIARDINDMTALANEIASDGSTATYLLDTTQATFGLSGAIEEDHRQLNVLQDEVKQTVVLINRLLIELRDDAARQTAYLANERSNLTMLSNSIKNGQLFGRSLVTPMTFAPSPAPIPTPAPTASRGKSKSEAPPLVVIRFDRQDVEFEQTLYTALSQALERHPAAEFIILAVSPSSGSAAAVQLAQSQSRANAERVFQSMSDMGLPSDRVQISSTTSGSISVNEVQVFVR